MNVRICLTMFGGQVSTSECGNQLQNASCLSYFPNRKWRAQVLVAHSCILCPWTLKLFFSWWMCAFIYTPLYTINVWWTNEYACGNELQNASRSSYFPDRKWQAQVLVSHPYFVHRYIILNSSWWMCAFIWTPLHCLVDKGVCLGECVHLSKLPYNVWWTSEYVCENELQKTSHSSYFPNRKWQAQVLVTCDPYLVLRHLNSSWWMCVYICTPLQCLVD